MTNLVVTRVHGPVFEIALNRDDKRNAITFAMWQELDQAIVKASRTPGIRVLVLRGEGRCFSAGIDVSAFMSLKDTYGPEWLSRGRTITADVQSVVSRLERLELPTVALLHGVCLGMGLELALACDLRIGSSDLRLGLPETLLGIVPDVGGTTRLARLVGPAKAKELIFTGRHVDAATALQLGILNQVVAGDDLAAAGQRLIDELLRAAPLAVAAAKRVIDGLFDGERGYMLEGWAQSQLFGTADFAEATRAFLEKRPPKFTGA